MCVLGSIYWLLTVGIFLHNYFSNSEIYSLLYQSQDSSGKFSVPDQVPFLLYTLKPRGGANKQDKFCRSKHDSQQVKGDNPLIASAISLHDSILGIKWSHAWQLDNTISALNKSLNKSMYQWLIIGLFSFILLHSPKFCLFCAFSAICMYGFRIYHLALDNQSMSSSWGKGTFPFPSFPLLSYCTLCGAEVTCAFLC